MNFLIELLAPVGSRDALIAAVESGADAVYLAGKMFGARAYAANFENEELRDAIRFAHKRNVRVDVAVNTMVDDSEFDALADYIRFLYNVGADAIIVQDLGVAKLAREIAPGLPLHASTQMTVHNLAGVKMMERLGFARVVLARELALADIQSICANCTAEIEVFVHGALCVCYSGQCLMSGMIGGRSGNRGRCAQPCRLPYTLVDETGRDCLAEVDAGEYLLSPKDMNAIELMPELIEAGVTSFKIEGRMKRPEYVAVVVDTYRRRIAAYLAQAATPAVSERDRKDLAQIFNRDFTTAYLKGRPGRGMMSDRRPNNRGVLAGRVLAYDMQSKQVKIKLSEELHLNDIVEFWVKVGGRVNAMISAMAVDGQPVEYAAANQEVVFQIPGAVRNHDRVFKIFDARLMERARGFFQAGASIRRIDLDVLVTGQIGRPLQIELRDAEGFHGEAETDFIAEKAIKRPLSEASVRKQIERLGTTVFALRELKCVLHGDVMVPVSEINEARRKAVERLEAARLATFDRPALQNSADRSYRKRLQPRRNAAAVRPELCVSVDTVEKVKIAMQEGADVILFGGDGFCRRPIAAADYRAAYELARAGGKKINFNTPRLIVGNRQTDAFKALFAALADCVPDAINVQNIAGFYALQELSAAPLHADAPLNIYNNLTLDYLKDMGAVSATLSPELNFTQVERIAASSAIPLECIVHGNLELMVSEYCALGSYLGGLGLGKCSQPCKQQSYWLLDRKAEKFPLVTDQDCRMHVLNGKELCMLPHVVRFAAVGIRRIRMEGKFMEEKSLGKWTRLYKEFMALGTDHPLLLQDQLRQIEPEQLTRGHYFRGVL